MKYDIVITAQFSDFQFCFWDTSAQDCLFTETSLIGECTICCEFPTVSLCSIKLSFKIALSLGKLVSYLGIPWVS